MKNLAVLITVLSFSGIGIAQTIEGTVDPQLLIDWVNAQKAVPANVLVQANGQSGSSGTGFCTQCSNSNSQPTNKPKTISLYGTTGTTGTVFFDADMDIDCDASNTGVCSGSDPSHQDMLSCDDFFNCSSNNGGSVDAAITPFYVIPEGSPMSYKNRGISSGQIAAVINTKNNSLTYAPFCDADGVAQEIGEASAALAAILGIDNDPNSGGQSSGVMYVIFTGSAGLLPENSMADHQAAIDLGSSLAEQLLATSAVYRPLSQKGQELSAFRISGKILNINASGNHSASIYGLNGKTVMSMSGTGVGSYDLSKLSAGTYVIKANIQNAVYTDRLIVQ